MLESLLSLFNYPNLNIRSSIHDFNEIDIDEGSDCNLPRFSEINQAEYLLQQEEKPEREIVEQIVFVQPPLKLMMDKGTQHKPSISNAICQADLIPEEERKEERPPRGQQVRMSIIDDQLEI